MIFTRRTAKYSRQDYKTNEDILSELKKLILLQRKFKITEVNGYKMFSEWIETDRQTGTQNCEI